MFFSFSEDAPFDSSLPEITSRTRPWQIPDKSEMLEVCEELDMKKGGMFFLESGVGS
jgi:hypothetical protein